MIRFYWRSRSYLDPGIFKMILLHCNKEEGGVELPCLGEGLCSFSTILSWF